MPEGDILERPRLDPEKFRDPARTVGGGPRASVALTALKTLWFNTGSLCNITCRNCYMDSSPSNDRLVYLRRDEAADFLRQIAARGYPVEEIGLTGGEPFMNPDIIAIMGDALSRGFRVLVLTNGMKPLWHKRTAMKALIAAHGDALAFRVSIDHHTREGHEAVRGANTWDAMARTLAWLIDAGANLAVAGRTVWGESESESRAGYGALFKTLDLPLDAGNPSHLVLFPEMDDTLDVPEITTACWSILGVRPDAQMCASSRMVVRRKGDAAPTVVPCTLLPYDRRFDLGPSLDAAEAYGPVALNHPHCARFCVLGGASCSV
ncbi:radical SAM protein [Varunaivibrio sulfuroxidans]|uniref:4Fe-4S single cluster protein n=1 Tax=Varunaivibrio sulfuroxidans TaxID=1773489 RepID=A0A4R3JGB2_9PROT|nr:radical SAM protein [Varunaivibrio sulfuroxidans]TCS64964.1 4Fe-4S single cluster protein [Varunaivibrio sulfuroxidans]WES29744.1 radical SAM protein [Varunaivibrio sulfuroxidans]